MNDGGQGDLPQPKRVFLSYAWEDDDYSIWVKRLATRLRKDGVNARLDAWHLPKHGIVAEFMNHEVREADWVLVLCSPLYKAKVHDTEDGRRIAGVGWEARLLTSAQIDNDNKVLACLTRGAWEHAAPDSLRSQYHFDLSDTSSFEKNYMELLRAITGTGEQAPPLGPLPENLGIQAVGSLRGAGMIAVETEATHPSIGTVVDKQLLLPPLGPIIVIAAVADLIMVLVVRSQLEFVTWTLAESCLFFAPFAIAIALFFKWLRDLVRRRRASHS